MKNYLKYFIVLFTLFMFNNCDSPVETDDYSSYYPMEIGNLWQYTRTFTVIGGSTMFSYAEITDTASITVEIRGTETLKNIDKAYVFLQTFESKRQTYYSTSYFANSDSSMFLYAYKGSGMFLPKPAPKYKIRFKGMYFESINQMTDYLSCDILPKIVLSDSLIYEDPPAKVLHYPLSVGDKWLFRDIPGLFTLHKKVISMEKISVPAGNFECYKIQYLYDFNEDLIYDYDITFFDYVNEKGLIKRFIYYKNTTLTDEEGNTIDSVDVIDESVLTDYSLN